MECGWCLKILTGFTVTQFFCPWLNSRGRNGKGKMMCSIWELIPLIVHCLLPGLSQCLSMKAGELSRSSASSQWRGVRATCRHSLWVSCLPGSPKLGHERAAGWCLGKKTYRELFVLCLLPYQQRVFLELEICRLVYDTLLRLLSASKGEGLEFWNKMKRVSMMSSEPDRTAAILIYVFKAQICKYHP